MWDSCGLVRCSHIVHLKLSVQAEQAEIATHLPPKKGSLDITRFTHLAAACVVRYLLGNELLLHLYVVVWKPWGSGKRWEEPLDRLASCGLDLEVNRWEGLVFQHIMSLVYMSKYISSKRFWGESSPRKMAQEVCGLFSSWRDLLDDLLWLNRSPRTSARYFSAILRETTELCKNLRIQKLYGALQEPKSPSSLVSAFIPICFYEFGV